MGERETDYAGKAMRQAGFLQRTVGGVLPGTEWRSPAAASAAPPRSPTVTRLRALLGVVWCTVIVWEVARHTVLAPWLSPGVRFNPTQTLVGAAVLGLIGSVLTLTLGWSVLSHEAALQSSKRELEGALHSLRETNRAVLSALADAIDARDPHTRKHSDDAAEMASAVARALGVPDNEVETIRLAAILHDIGKLGIPDRILCKPGPLTPEERAIIQRHPDLGADIVEHIPFLRGVADLVRHHQERYDGRGYPAGLAANAIPLGARIVAVVDAYSAMTSDRPYRKALTHGEAIAELRRHAGTQFSPEVVSAFVAVMEGGNPGAGAWTLDPSSRKKKGGRGR